MRKGCCRTGNIGIAGTFTSGICEAAAFYMRLPQDHPQRTVLRKKVVGVVDMKDWHLIRAETARRGISLQQWVGELIEPAIDELRRSKLK